MAVILGWCRADVLSMGHVDMGTYPILVTSVSLLVFCTKRVYMVSSECGTPQMRGIVLASAGFVHEPRILHWDQASAARVSAATRELSSPLNRRPAPLRILGPC